ncbi:MAG: acyl-ACP--UDP-N-acetylglucosamine O-acyltransferase, partial [Elusimicrobiota bacterium]
MSVKIHPTAVLDSAAEIDIDVEIGPYTVIGKDVQIKKGNYVGPHCIIEFADIGKNNYFTGHDFIGTPPQDFKYKLEKTKLTIGDNNIIREGVSLHRGSTSTHVTTIGSGCMFMANSHVGHDCRIGNGVVMVNSAAASGHVEIEDKAVISGLCGIHQFSRIGTLAMLGGGAMVSQDILPYTMAQGDRAKLVGLNIVGIRRA